MRFARVLVAMSAATAISSSEAQQSSALILTNATIIDGSSSTPRPNQTVVIRGDRITEVYSGPPRAVSSTDRMVDARGRFLVPGFIDAHVHVATDPTGRDANAAQQLAGALAGGVTGVRDMAGDAVVLRDLAKAGELPEAASPRIRYAAVFGGPSFFADPRTKASAHGGTPGELPWLRAVEPQTDLATAIAQAKATGASGIKIYADLPAADVGRVVREAHAQGLAVWSHATVYPAKPSESVAAGVNVISHAILLYWEGARIVPTRYHSRGPSAVYDSLDINGGAMDRLLRRMARDSVILDATLFISARLETAPPGTAGMADPRRAVQWMYDVTKRARELGVRVAAGTDGMMPGSTSEPPNIHREMELLVTRAGFSPYEAIVAATRNSAAAAGWNDVGSIKAGKRADIVILEANPLEDIRNTRRVQAVIKGGHLHPRPDE